MGLFSNLLDGLLGMPIKGGQKPNNVSQKVYDGSVYNGGEVYNKNLADLANYISKRFEYKGNDHVYKVYSFDGDAIDIEGDKKEYCRLTKSYTEGVFRLSFLVYPEKGIVFPDKTSLFGMGVADLKKLSNILSDGLKKFSIQEFGGETILYKYKDSKKYPLGLYKIAFVYLGGEAYENSKSLFKEIKNIENSNTLVKKTKEEKISIGNVFTKTMKGDEHYSSTLGKVGFINNYDAVSVSLPLSKEYKSKINKSSSSLEVGFKILKGKSLILSDNSLYGSIIQLDALNMNLAQALLKTNLNGIEGCFYLIKGKGARKYVIHRVDFNSVL